MNISAMAAQRYLSRKPDETKNQPAEEDGASKSFESKLLELRVEMNIKRTDTVEKTSGKPAQALDKPSFFDTGNPLLFDAWGDSVPIEEALKALDANLSRIGDYSLSSGISIEEALEHIASQASLYKNRIIKGEASEQLKNLNAIIEKHTEKLARGFAQEVGSFFEGNGMTGEGKRMYDSVKERISFLTRDYDAYITKRGSDFEAIAKAAGEGRKSLAFELRIAYKKDGNGERFSSIIPAYSRKELTAAAALVKASEEITRSGKGGTVSEEELGVRLGAIALNGLSFLQGSSAAKGHKAAFLSSIGTHLNKLMDESDAMLAAKSGSSDDADLYKPLDRRAVLSVVKAMTEHYNATGSIKRALRIGTERGLSTYLSKADLNHGTERYRGSDYWNGQLNMLVEEHKNVKKREYKSPIPIFEAPLNALLSAAFIDFKA